MKKAATLLVLLSIQGFASAPVPAGFQPQHSSVGHLTMLAPATFTPAHEPGVGNAEVAGRNGQFIHINVNPMLGALSGGKPPSKAQVAQILSINGPSPDLELSETSLDGHPGVLAKTTHLGTSSPQWTVLFFGAGGLQIEAQGSDPLPATKQICERIIASVKFDR